MFWLMHVAIKMFYDEIRKLFAGQNGLLNLFMVRTNDDTHSDQNNFFCVILYKLDAYILFLIKTFKNFLKIINIKISYRYIILHWANYTHNIHFNNVNIKKSRLTDMTDYNKQINTGLDSEL